MDREWGISPSPSGVLRFKIAIGKRKKRVFNARGDIGRRKWGDLLRGSRKRRNLALFLIGIITQGDLTIKIRRGPRSQSVKAKNQNVRGILTFERGLPIYHPVAEKIEKGHHFGTKGKEKRLSQTGLREGWPESLTDASSVVKDF